MKTRDAKTSGKVYLVGAGPGRPDLITLRGAECLSKADVVVMDALASRRLLEHCRPDVQVLEAGKRGHGHVLMKQPAINRLLARLARAGKTVVRLKGGDPYFFGRGGEEAEFLHGQGVPFEVVPGVSSVSAVPAYAGIPVTHRGHTSTVTVVTGHAGIENPYLQESRRDVRKRMTPGVDWERLSPHNTLVVLMGVGQLPAIVAKLRGAGWPADTPVAVTQWGTLPFQRSVQGALSDIASKVKQAKLGAPAVIVAGSVVKLRPTLDWFERLPLFGRRLLVTRAQAQASQFARLLEAEGAWVQECPAIRVEPLPLDREGREHLKNLSHYEGVLFTSANAVRVFLAHWSKLNRPWPRTPLYAIGLKTAEALVAGGLPVHGIAKESVAESLAELLGPVAGERYLFPRAEEGRDVLLQTLKERGARVDLWPLYRTRPEKLDPQVRKKLLAGELDCVTFTSSSTVRYLFQQIPSSRIKNIFHKTAAAAIGPVTAQTLQEYGVVPRIQPRRSTIEDLAAAIRRHFSSPRKAS